MTALRLNSAHNSNPRECELGYDPALWVCVFPHKRTWANNTAEAEDSCVLGMQAPETARGCRNNSHGRWPLRSNVRSWTGCAANCGRNGLLRYTFQRRLGSLMEVGIQRDRSATEVGHHVLASMSALDCGNSTWELVGQLEHILAILEVLCK